ncbi:MAG: dUTP diphosphatase [Acidimicrobiales bacterium]|nr:dUTP diphosphatase [Acidimicrobiales bacterium]
MAVPPEPTAALELHVRRLDPALPLPRPARHGDAGLDLLAAHDLELASGGGRGIVGTGLAVAIPFGCCGLILPRSGLARHHGVTCLNTPGLIDAGYRGELQVLLINTDPAQAYTVQRGDRVAQLVVMGFVAVRFVEVDELEDSDRGESGWGHTGR